MSCYMSCMSLHYGQAMPLYLTQSLWILSPSAQLFWLSGMLICALGCSSNILLRNFHPLGALPPCERILIFATPPPRAPLELGWEGGRKREYLRCSCVCHIVIDLRANVCDLAKMAKIIKWQKNIDPLPHEGVHYFVFITKVNSWHNFKG